VCVCVCVRLHVWRAAARVCQARRKREARARDERSDYRSSLPLLRLAPLREERRARASASCVFLVAVGPSLPPPPPPPPSSGQCLSRHVRARPCSSEPNSSSAGSSPRRIASPRSRAKSRARSSSPPTSCSWRRARPATRRRSCVCCRRGRTSTPGTSTASPRCIR